jgi:hypothetical protein
LKRFYFTRDKSPLNFAYKKMLDEFYKSGYRLERGTKVPVHLPEGQYPTLRQFRFAADKEKLIPENLIARYGQRNFDKDHRPLMGKSKAHGPGEFWQIDATTADIHLVSSVNRQVVVGRPSLYLLTDVFSHMVVGFHLSLENYSYKQAAQAIVNAATNKVELCESWGIEISPGEWPAFGLPEGIVADGGEMLGKKADTITNDFGIMLRNTPPYRPDMKGLIESTFQIANRRLFHHLPGGVKGMRTRGERDPRLDSRLDLQELTKLLIEWILWHNNRRLENYPAGKFELEAGVPHIPSELWRWGLAQGMGRLQSPPIGRVRRLLLPSAQAALTKRGISFHKAYYTCPTAKEEHWALNARENGSRKIDIVYDPSNAGVIYWKRSKHELEPCTLIEDYSAFARACWEEVDTSDSTLKEPEVRKALQDRETGFHAHVEQIVERAEKESAQAAKDRGSKTLDIENVREKRKEEIAIQQGAVPSVPAKPEPTPTEYRPPQSFTGLLRSLRKNEKPS